MTSTHEPIKPADVAAIPEFVDSHGLKRLFGISRSHAYLLANAGQIRSVSLRQRGHTKGRRLFDCDSVRAFLRANYAEPKVSETK